MRVIRTSRHMKVAQEQGMSALDLTELYQKTAELKQMYHDKVVALDELYSQLSEAGDEEGSWTAQKVYEDMLEANSLVRGALAQLETTSRLRLNKALNQDAAEPGGPITQRQEGIVPPQGM